MALWSQVYSGLIEGILYPVQGVVFDSDDIKPAGGQLAMEVALAQCGQPLLGTQDQAPLLVPVYTGKRPSVARVTALAHFQKDKMILMPQNQVNFPKTSTQLPRQNASTLGGDMIAGTLFGLIAPLLTGGALWSVFSGLRANALTTPQSLVLCLASVFKGIHRDTR